LGERAISGHGIAAGSATHSEHHLQTQVLRFEKIEHDVAVSSISMSAGLYVPTGGCPLTPTSLTVRHVDARDYLTLFALFTASEVLPRL
jgi:hypothetical protein